MPLNIAVKMKNDVVGQWEGTGYNAEPGDNEIDHKNTTKITNLPSLGFDNKGTPTASDTLQLNSNNLELKKSSVFTLCNEEAVHTLIPAADDAHYLGKIGSPYTAFKALILKDTTNGKHYKVETINGTLTATALD